LKIGGKGDGLEDQKTDIRFYSYSLIGGFDGGMYVAGIRQLSRGGTDGSDIHE